MSISRVSGVAGAFALLAALGACASGSQISAFDREQVPADEVTELGLPDYAFENLELDSARFGGTHDGTDFYLAKGQRESPFCLLIYGGTDDWVNTCGDLPVQGGSGTINARLVPDGIPLPEGWTQVGENVQVAP